MTHAALQADYRIIKPVAGRSCYILQLEVPWEAFDEVNRVLGAPPKPGENRWVGVALIDPFHARPAPIEKQEENEEKLLKDGVSRPPRAKGEHGEYAAKLYKSYFMRNEKVCRVLGTEADYKLWIQKQESCISGKQDYIDMDSGEMRCEESHVERVAAGHGEGIKAPYHSVPLTHDEHQFRHQKGELECLLKFDKMFRYNYEGAPYPKAAALWFEKHAMEYREKWVHERLCAEFKVKSLTDIDPEKLRKWCEFKGIEEALPK